MDSNFYLIEEKPATHIYQNGIGIKLTSDDYNWCKKCFIYVIMNIYQEDRYYISSLARRENDQLSKQIPSEIFVNPFS